jgi:hypothetical protein
MKIHWSRTSTWRPDLRTYSPCDFNTAQRRQADIRADHIRSQRFSLTDGIQPVRGFANDQ